MKNQNITVKNNPGQWVRQQYLFRWASVLILLVLSIGISLGVFLHQATNYQVALYSSMAFMVLVLIATFSYAKFMEPRWVKGVIAERNVAGVIECALSAEGCATAHGVTNIPNTIGDIDHLVATPGCLWVVETKHRWVPKKHFQKVLQRIATNTKAVQKWHTNSNEVRACLVLAHIDPREPLQYETDNIQIKVFDRRSFMNELKHGVHHQQDVATLSATKVTADRIWGLTSTSMTPMP
ncbi:MAG: nuclease-related domain-containing protein [Candidatus Tectomicrobia bacterium]|nr:nuclease-related domain-containing protein [Candidatus Tectomicrobia bacterium]